VIDTLQHGPILELRLNRPPVNALSPELMLALRQAVDAAAHDGSRAIVLSGMPRRFSAGLDLPLLLTFDRARIVELWHNLYDLLTTIAGSPLPVAAAITGHAPAGGTVLTLFCDWRVMASGDWKVGLNEVQVGLTLPGVIFRALKLVVGHRQADRLATTGLLMAPEEALGIGLIDEVAPAECVVPRAIQWCQALVALPARAMTGTRAQSRAELVEIFRQDLKNEFDEILEMWWSPETQSTLRGVVEQLGKKKLNSAKTS